MNILLIIITIIVGLIAILLIIAAFTKKSYSIQRETVINRPIGDVFDYIRYLKNQDYFNKWVMMDPNLKKSFRGTDGTVGFVYAWEGNKKAGKGEQEIKNISENKKMEIEVRFEKPFKGISQAPFTTEAIAANQTKVTWGLSSTMNYPMNVMLVFMNMDKLLGNDMETSLGNLKSILQKN